MPQASPIAASRTLALRATPIVNCCELVNCWQQGAETMAGAELPELPTIGDLPDAILRSGLELVGQDEG